MKAAYMKMLEFIILILDNGLLFVVLLLLSVSFLLHHGLILVVILLESDLVLFLCLLTAVLKIVEILNYLTVKSFLINCRFSLKIT